MNGARVGCWDASHALHAVWQLSLINHGSSCSRPQLWLPPTPPPPSASACPHTLYNSSHTPPPLTAQVLEELPEKVRVKVPVEVDPQHSTGLEAVKRDMAALEASECTCCPSASLPSRGCVRVRAVGMLAEAPER